MKRTSLWLSLLTALAPGYLQAIEDPLLDLSLEELVRTDVTSVSRKSQSLTDVPAAAFVISSEDIRRSGARALPDLLRMVPGLQVAQIDNGRYAVTSRSFNGRFANKLQVLVDGRSIYHPLFAGVLWELDPIPLEDIERIEVIRGAGAVMWGANAVNGLINIISKTTRNQTGGSVSVGGGTQGNAMLYARIGQTLDNDASWKLSTQVRHADASRRDDFGGRSNDALDNAVVDFRFDKSLGNGRDFSIWANASRSSTGDLWRTQPTFTPFPTPSISLADQRPDQILDSQSLVGRYRWIGDSGIESTLQGSITRSGIDITAFIKENRTTYDLDYQGRYAIGAHDLTWGLNHRSSNDEMSTNEPYVAIAPKSYTQQNTGIFLHDDWTLLPDTLKFGIGGRADVTSRNGTNYSANATLLWTPTRTDSAWIKLAQAPRTAARAEKDVSILAGVTVVNMGVNIPVITYVDGDNKLGPEMSRGVELGYRKQFSSTLNADLTAYRYRLTDLRSGTSSGAFACFPNPTIPVDYARCGYFGLPPGMPVIFNLSQTSNGAAGWNDGVELAVDWLPLPSWRLQLSYAWSRLRMDRSGDPTVDADSQIAERAHPRHVASLRSQWNVSSNQQLDLWLRGNSAYDRFRLVELAPSATGAPTYDRIPAYLTLDLRYAYRWNKDLELSLVGRNLLQNRRVEYVSDFIPTARTQISPTWMLFANWKF